MLVRITIPSSSTEVIDEGVLIMSANTCFQYDQKSAAIKPKLLLLDRENLKDFSVLAEFNEGKNALLQSFRNVTFLGIDNKLLMSQNLRTWQTVLESDCANNFFWHMTKKTEDVLFAQEYGINSVIYRSTDSGESWQKIVTCRDIDQRAVHFHSIAYDQYRNLLLATLGDSNPIKIVKSDDLGETWKPVYSGAFQCLPIAVSKDYVAFGMDSAISSGIIVWKPKENRIDSIHLKFDKKLGVKDWLQASDLKLVGDDTWLMSTGKGSLLFSNDLREWDILHLGNKEEDFNSHNISDARNGLLSVAMGNELVIVKLDDLRVDFQKKGVRHWHAFLPRIIGFGYVAKRKISFPP